jgi:purine-binding chemotaxis protein CheW
MAPRLEKPEARRVKKKQERNVMAEKDRKEGAAGLDTAALAGKYLTFTLGPETYGLEILKVQEIIGLMNITKVPQTPDHVRGVINLRGRVIPVVELRRKFNLETVEDTERTCIIVVQVDTGESAVTMGILVDEVSEVVDISEAQLEPPPAFGASIDTAFILAMGKIGENVVVLLDVDRVLTTGDRTLIDRLAAEQN